MIGSLDKTAAEDLLKYPPNAWCRAYFDTVCKNYKVVNNFTESVHKWISEARGKPIIKMLEEIRTKVIFVCRNMYLSLCTHKKSITYFPALDIV